MSKKILVANTHKDLIAKIESLRKHSKIIASDVKYYDVLGVWKGLVVVGK